MYFCVLPLVKKEKELKLQLNPDEFPPFSPLLTCRPPHPPGALYSHLLYFISVCRCTTERWMQDRYYIKMYCYLKCNKEI